MTLSEELVALFDLVEDREGAGALFEDDALGKLQSYGEFHEVTQQFSQNVHDPAITVLLALRSLANQKSQLKPQLADVRLVATFPNLAKSDARHTLQVVREMICNAREEILVAGFAISEGGGLLEMLLESPRSVNRIAIICGDWKPDSGPDVVGLFKKGWPGDRSRPAIYQYTDPEGKAEMHVKCLIVDAREMLIGSANFTYSGMKRNYELGVRIKGDLARSARDIFDSFLASGDFRRVDDV